MKNKQDSSEILKMAFGLSELLGKRFPESRFKVLPGLMVSVGLQTEEVSSACVVSDRYQITLTENRIVLNVTSIDAIKGSSVIGQEADKPSLVDVEYSFMLDKPEQQHVFDLQDPQAIDRIVQVIDEDVKK